MERLIESGSETGSERAGRGLGWGVDVRQFFLRPPMMPNVPTVYEPKLKGIWSGLISM